MNLYAFFSGIGTTLSGAAEYLTEWIKKTLSSPDEIYLHLVKWLMPVLALYIVYSVIKRMMRVKNPAEVWGYIYAPDMGRFPISHWECTIGRGRRCDIKISLATVSNTQCALIRDDKGSWYIHDLSGRNTTEVNGRAINSGTKLHHGDTITLGGLDFSFQPITKQELEIQKEKRIKQSSPISPWLPFIALTFFQVLTVIEFTITRQEYARDIVISYAVLCALMWLYLILTALAGQRGFEPEILAFFACTLNLAVTASSTPETILKQTAAICMGAVLFIVLGVYLRDLKRTVKARRFMAVLTVLLFTANIIFGKLQYGARNWISFFGVSVQPSEIAKICFIFAGAATLDRLFAKRNFIGFMLLSFFCLMALAVTGDFGTAAIFFVVFIIIAFLRSGDFAVLSLICGAAGAAILAIIRFRPYIADRFSAWGHAWEFASTSGYQQVRTMSAAASGGLAGVGAGKGWLQNLGAADTDLVFGMLCEEWGLIIALLAVAIIFTLSVFAFRVVQSGRSSYYTIAACATSSLFVFQTMLNVFGAVDILPLTGVTFPFISCGGTSMITCWGLLAFIKAADTRQNASFAVRRKSALGDAPPDPLSDGGIAAANIHKVQDMREQKKRKQEELEEIENFLSSFNEIDSDKK